MVITFLTMRCYCQISSSKTFSFLFLSTNRNQFIDAPFISQGSKRHFLLPIFKLQRVKNLIDNKAICSGDLNFPPFRSKLNNFQHIIFDSPSIVASSIGEDVQKIHNLSFIRLFELLRYRVKKVFGIFITR